jgi:hypothetical protein
MIVNFPAFMKEPSTGALNSYKIVTLNLQDVDIVEAYPDVLPAKAPLYSHVTNIPLEKLDMAEQYDLEVFLLSENRLDGRIREYIVLRDDWFAAISLEVE